MTAEPLNARCPFCGLNGLVPRHKVRTHDYVTCPGCGVVSLFPFPGPEEVRGWYNDPAYFEQASGNSGYVDYAGLRQGFHRTFRRRNSLLGEAFWQGGPRVLEIGCALGFYPEALPAEVQRRYLGLDLNERAVAEVNAKGFAARAGDLDHIAERDAFDLVVFFDVIEHVPDPRAFLDQVARVLKDGGRILFTTPSTTSALARVSGAKWVSYIVPHHILLYEPKSLSSLLAEQGFTVQTIGSEVQWVPLSFLNERLGTLLPPLRRLGRAVEFIEQHVGRTFLPVPNGNLLVTAQVRKDSVRR